MSNQKEPPAETENEEPAEETEAVEAEEEATTAEAAEAATAEAIDDGLRIAELENEVAELKDQLLRALAEAENLRRRGQRDREDAAKYAITGFARDLLAVADNLGRALESVPDEADAALKSLAEGVRMTERELATVFERVGIKKVEAEGQPFDHNVHQAMFEVENPDVPSGTVVNVMAAGYMIRERLLRPAMVGVSKGGPKAPAEDLPPAEAEPPEPADPEAAAKTGAYDKPAEDAPSGGKVDTQT